MPRVGSRWWCSCFSILSRIEFAATLVVASAFPASLWVSVSSLGSNSLQRCRGGRRRWRGRRFQYPLSDRIRCNREGHPTRRRRRFQYPLSDRIRCNRRVVERARENRLRFSILSRIEFAATPLGASAAPGPAPVSVSSLGSNSLQQALEIIPTSKIELVSVSSLGSNSLQLKIPGLSVATAWSVSVSSLGSNSLQQAAEDAELKTLGLSFSILSRIEFAATVGSINAALQQMQFQYPLSDRIRCNRCWCRRGAARAAGFQYPLSDRIRCNFSNPV